MSDTHITRDGLPARLRALAENEIAGRSPVLSPGNSHDLLTAADEIARLRLTDAERHVLREVRDIYADEDDIKCNEIAAVIDGLLERTKGGAT